MQEKETEMEKQYGKKKIDKGIVKEEDQNMKIGAENRY
jgi:hypothetical protein